MAQRGHVGIKKETQGNTSREASGFKIPFDAEAFRKYLQTEHERHSKRRHVVYRDRSHSDQKLSEPVSQ